ncbi:MAG: prepilin-type N-terminal cleavage/methylation domain-containing protein [Eubacteriales bacterium]
MKKIKSKLNQKGFSLIELMVVIVIMLILAAIAIPAFMGVIQDSRDSAATANARTVLSLTQLEVNKAESIDPSNWTMTFSEVVEAAGITDATEISYFSFAQIGSTLTVSITYDNGNTTVTVPEP